MSQDKEREAFEAHFKPATWESECAKLDMPVPKHKVRRYYFRDDELRWEAWQARSALASQQAVKGEPQWREHVEQRIRTWRQRTMNKSGDRLAIDDFMGQDSIDDLVDFVCDEWAAPPSREPLTEWEARGTLARLKCWHRLTEQEADELVQFAMQGGIHSREGGSNV